MIAEPVPSASAPFEQRSGLVSLLREVAAQPGGDLPASADPRATYPRLAVVLSAVAVPAVLATAAGHVSRGFGFSDVVALGAILLAVAAVSTRIGWTRHDERWLFAIVAAQVVYVASLGTMTGGGASPYFALYAPVLALAGWYLRAEFVALTVVLVASTEIWRAVAIERSGTADQVTIALPFFAGLAALSWFTADRLAGAIVTIRQGQVRTAATLDGVRAIGADVHDDPLGQLVVEAQRIFGGRAGIVTFQGTDMVDVEAAVPMTGHGGFLRIALSGARGNHGLLQLWREEPFEVNEIRLAGILAGAAARAADTRWLFDRVREESERDALTGLLNRRALDRDLGTTFAALAADPDAPAATLFFIDVDGLKAFNDRHGHAQGDRLLQATAEELLAIVRRGDGVYRYGGDEFAVLAHDLTEAEADAYALRLAAVPSPARRRRLDDSRPTAGLSIGMARTTPAMTDPVALLEAADAAMYEAKGRRIEGLDHGTNGSSIRAHNDL